MRILVEPRLFEEVEARSEYIRGHLLQWGRANYRNFPWRTHRTPYSVLVAEILLKRTTASAVLSVYEEFMELFPDLQALSRADQVTLEKLLSKIGYHRKRAKDLLDIAEAIQKRFNGQIPKSEDALLEIPYVGNYTANAILSLGYNLSAAMVDTNVARIIKRIFNNKLPQKPPEKTIQRIADILVPYENHQAHNLALLDFGALVCTYGIPRCKLCPINQSCDYYRGGKPYR